MKSQQVVFTNGCFDVLHRGHYELLSYCKMLGIVIVGINSDESVKRLKGENRPLNSLLDRVFALESCKFVDRVVVFEEDTPYELIKSLKPDIIVKGGDYVPEKVVGNELAEVRIFPYIQGKSSSIIIDKIDKLNK